MRILIAGVLTTAMTFGTDAANAGQPAYVGNWGKDTAQCKNGQEINNAPMLIARSALLFFVDQEITQYVDNEDQMLG